MDAIFYQYGDGQKVDGGDWKVTATLDKRKIHWVAIK